MISAANLEIGDVIRDDRAGFALGVVVGGEIMDSTIAVDLITEDGEEITELYGLGRQLNVDPAESFA